MAEEERQWLQRHAHETNTIAYGTVGSATYDQQEKTWKFSRELFSQLANENENENDASNTTGGIPSSLLLLSDDAEIILEPTCTNVNGATHNRESIKLTRDLPTLAAALPIARQESRQDERVGFLRAVTGVLVDIGSAVVLGISGVDSGNQSVPIMASAAGEDASILRFAFVSQKSLDYTDSNGMTSKITVPSLVNETASTWLSTEPILQVLFSHQYQGGHGDTFLAVRQASQTTIFQPLVPRDSSIAFQGDALQPNKLLSIGLDATGGHSHADVAFNPHSRTRFVIVDVEGNWSTWHIEGQRSHTARILYTAQLSASGKMFSWSHKKRPEGIGLYFDGWHRILWLSSDQSHVDRLLVCNRQSVKLFDLKGSELLSVDARLDTKKVFSYIVDVKAGPATSMCFILTTAKLLLFDIAQTEWRDVGRKKGPALLCAWDHYHHFTDLSLRVSLLHSGDETLVVLYSNRTTQIRFCLLRMMESSEGISVASSTLTSLTLPRTTESRITSVFPLLTEAKARQHSIALRLPQFVQILSQYENLALSYVTAIWRTTGSSKSHGHEQEILLKLPPTRASKFKSERRIDSRDDDDDGDDIAGFIVPDSTMTTLTNGVHTSNISVSEELPKPIAFSKLMPQIAGFLINGQNAAAPSTKPSILESFADLSDTLQNFESSEENLLAKTISELLTESPRIDDAEEDSAALSYALQDLAHQLSNLFNISTLNHGLTAALSDMYEELFDRHVSSLTPSMPSRARIQREWIVREIAMDLELSSHCLRRSMYSTALAENSAPPEDTAVLSSDAAIFSDSIQPPDGNPNYLSLSVPDMPPMISASQPQPDTTSGLFNNTSISLRSQRPPTAADTSKPQSHLQGAVLRLSALTAFTLPPPPPPPPPSSSTTISDIPTATAAATDPIADLLSHLPASTDADADPTLYDWATAELNIATARAHDSALLTAQSDPKARRKVERLAKARRRAEQIRKEVERDQERRSVIPAILSAVEIEAIGDRMGMLPFREPAAPSRGQMLSSPALVSREKRREAWSQPQAMMLASEADEDGQPESSTQAQLRHDDNRVALTQPERGVFGGARSVGVDVGRGRDKDKDERKRKKVKTIPGFR